MKMSCRVLVLYLLYLFFALISFITELNRTGSAYKIGEKSMNHLFYMNDLKLFAKDDHELERLLQTVKKFSNAIGMNFGPEKCAKATFLNGSLQISCYNGSATCHHEKKEKKRILQKSTGHP